jgi:L,D-peptidoglycan transpeptidase YkuD (ErfK/YbiS/YcfS/YnhG family)
MRHIITILFLYGIISTVNSQLQSSAFTIPESTYQIILVTSGSWSSKDGNLQRYEKSNGKWTKTGQGIAVAVGKNGMAWGKGLHANTDEPEKKEGDGKAPAGVFAFGHMFGYSEQTPSTLNFPYRQSTSRDYFIDDVNSSDYNQWVTIPADRPNTPGERWASYEKMKRADHLYEYGIVVLHNSAPIEKGKGSAIFFHVWRSPGAGTLGCTSMAKENLLLLMKWMDPKKKPLLIQIPESEVKRFWAFN